MISFLPEDYKIFISANKISLNFYPNLERQLFMIWTKLSSARKCYRWCYFYFFLYFVSSFRIVIKLKVQKFPTYPLLPHMHSLLLRLTSLTTWYFFFFFKPKRSLYGHIIITQSLLLTSKLTLGIHSVGLEKGIVICVHHYNIIQNIFTALKIFFTLPFHLFTDPSQTATDLFTVSKHLF